MGRWGEAERKTLFDFMGLVSYGGGKRFTEHGILRASAGGTGSGSAPAATSLTSGSVPCAEIFSATILSKPTQGANQSLRPSLIYAIMNDIVYGGEGN